MSGLIVRYGVWPKSLPVLLSRSFKLSILSKSNAESIIKIYCPNEICQNRKMAHTGKIISDMISFCLNNMSTEYVPLESDENIIIECLCNTKYSNDIDKFRHRSYYDTHYNWGSEVKSALLIYLRLIVNKTSKENLKPRKGLKSRTKFLQCNMQKSHHAQIDLNRRISNMNKAIERFICCIQEPCSANSKLIHQPNSIQRYGKTTCPRTCKYTDTKTEAWFMEALSSKDITVVQVNILSQEVLVVSAYLDSSCCMDYRYG